MDTASLTREKDDRSVKIINSPHVVFRLRWWRGVTPLRLLYVFIALPVIPNTTKATRALPTDRGQSSSYWRKNSLGLNCLLMSVTSARPVTILVTSSPMFLKSGAALFRLRVRSLRHGRKLHTKMCKENWRNCTDRRRQKCSEEVLHQRPFVQHEILQWLDRNRSQAFAVREKKLIAWDM